MKAKQAGEYCICPDCENEIQIPLESAVTAKRTRNKKRRGKRATEVEVELRPVSKDAHSIELVARGQEKARSTAKQIDAQIRDVESDDWTAKKKSIEKKASDPVNDVETDGGDESGKSAADRSLPAAVESFDDSGAAIVDLLSSEEQDIPDDDASESSSFLLAKPVAKIESDPLKSNPDLVWYLRHKRLGEKGPLKAREVEAMLESGKIESGYIAWREDWNDWIPVEEIFPELAAKSPETGYQIPSHLNPHSEASRKRRAEKRFWMCFNAAAFLLVAVLVYWLTHFGC